MYGNNFIISWNGISLYSLQKDVDTDVKEDAWGHIVKSRFLYSLRVLKIVIVQYHWRMFSFFIRPFEKPGRNMGTCAAVFTVCGYNILPKFVNQLIALRIQIIQIDSRHLLSYYMPISLVYYYTGVFCDIWTLLFCII